MEINLTQEKGSLEERICDIESRIAPMQKELNELRERLLHVKALMPGEQIKFVSSSGDKLKRGFWAQLTRELDLVAGVDSAHRVVKRADPEFHNSIPHQCVIDGRRYP